MKNVLRMKLLAMHQMMMVQGMLLQASKIMHLLTTGKVTLYLIGTDWDVEWELMQLGVTNFSYSQNTYSKTYVFNEEKYANIIKQNM